MAISPAMGFGIGKGIIGLGSAFKGGGTTPSLYDNGNPMAGVQQMQMQSNEIEAKSLEEQAQQAMYEAGLEAQQKAREAHLFRENQANTYSASGVLLEGSPMEVLNETRSLAQQEVDMILKRGQATGNVLRGKAFNTRSEGRAAVLGQNIKFASDAASAKMTAIGSRQTPFVDFFNDMGKLLPGATKGTP